MKETRQRALGRRVFGGLAAGVGLAVALSACAGSSDPLSTPPQRAAPRPGRALPS